MDKRKLSIVILAAVVILGAAIFAWVGRENKLPERVGRSQSPTRAEVPEGIDIPIDISQFPTGSRPTAILPAVGTSGTTGPFFRDYGTAQISGGEFLPKTIYLRVGDTLHVNFHAVDQAYDVVQPDMGLKISLARGETKLMEFMGIEQGRFTFFCESCGGPDQGPRGEFIVIRSLKEVIEKSQ